MPHTRYDIKVDSIASEEIILNKHYVLIPLNKNISFNDLRFKEYSSQIEKALEGKGYTRVKNAKDAKLVIFLDYSISKPNQETRTGISYRAPRESTTTLKNSYGQTLGSFNTKSTSGNLETYKYTSTSFIRTISISAFDIKTLQKYNENASPLWETLISSKGTTGNLRAVFKFIIYGASEYIASDTKGQKDIDLEVSEKTEIQIDNYFSSRNSRNIASEK